MVVLVFVRQPLARRGRVRRHRHTRAAAHAALLRTAAEREFCLNARKSLYVRNVQNTVKKREMFSELQASFEPATLKATHQMRRNI